MGHLQNFKYELEGPDQAEVVVFLHGVMGSGANWRRITPTFRKSYRVLTYDQRGHGWSFKPEKGYGPENYAEDLKLILDELKIEKIHLVGHSMGGRNALHFAHEYPDRLLSLVIEDIGPEGNPKAMERTAHLLDLVPTPFVSKAAAKEFFEKEFPNRIANHPQKKILGSYFFTNIEEKSDGTADWRFNKNGILISLKAGHFRPRWEQVRDLKCPTLFIRGQNSDDLTAQELAKVKQVNPHIQTVEIANAGHWVHFEQPEEFIRVLAEFFDIVGQGR
jgi:esterase